MTDQPTGAPPAAELQFDTAEHIEPTPASISCVGCKRDIESVYHTLNGRTICSSCRGQVENLPGGSYLKAMLFGSAAGIAGWAVYFAVLKLTDTEVGLIAILVGYLVGRAVRKGSAERGGRLYQVMAVVITYLSITASYTPMLASEMGKNGGPAVVTWIAAELTALVFPFFTVTESPIGLVILGVGLWQAWKLNQRASLTITGPHQVAGAPAAQAALA